MLNQMSRMWNFTCLSGSLAIAFLLSCSLAAAAFIADLYRSTAVVSGQGETNRAKGLALCLEDVLVKVSGDPRLIGDQKVVELTSQAIGFVAHVQYRDRMSGVPMHDEQGSYDRPHDLTVDFDAKKIDAALRSLGRKPWLSPRPQVVVFLAVNGRKEKFALTSESDRDPDMRSSLAAAAERVGLPMVLPTNAQLIKQGWNVETLQRSDISNLDAAAVAAGSELALAGTLTWNDSALGWIADWRMRSEARNYRWQIRGVGFDDAFRNGMRGAVQVLSGHGQPQ
jgi:hypothetical protein